MIKCISCKSSKVILKIEDSKYMAISECYNCCNIVHLFIDDYFLNYKEYNNFFNNIKNKNDDNSILFCQKHSKKYISFCLNCKINLCDECLLSHNSSLHSIKEIQKIINEEEKELIIEYKKELTMMKDLINKKINDYKKEKENEEENYIKLLNSMKYMLQIKEKIIDINLKEENVNTYDIISLKYILDKYNKAKINTLINNLKQISYKEKKNEINHYKNCVYYSINSIPNNKIINIKYGGWVNHVIQLRNGNIMSAHWDQLLVYKIINTNNKYELILKININNGSINHIYEYKNNKILLCDNKMKIIQLSQDNKNFKCLNVLDYGRKIIPFIPEKPIYSGDKNFIFMCTPNGIKLYSYLDYEDNYEDDIINDLKYIGVFSTEYDYSAIIQVSNKICGIYKKRNNYNNNFALWEIKHDFNDEIIFDVNKFINLGEIKNINSSIGRYSLCKINNSCVAVGNMKNNYHAYSPNEKSGISIISLESVEIVQFIQTDEITSLECLCNGIILTGGKNLNNNKYYIKEWKYDEDYKELLFVGEKNMHNDFINTILEVKDGYFMSCGRDGNVYIVYNYN